MHCKTIQDMIKCTPWLLRKEYIKIIDTYEAKIIEIRDKYYMIEFSDSNMDIVESLLPKIELKFHIMHPVKIEPDYCFHLVIHKIIWNNETTIGAWPIVKYWNKTLKE